MIKVIFLLSVLTSCASLVKLSQVEEKVVEQEIDALIIQDLKTKD